MHKYLIVLFLNILPLFVLSAAPEYEIVLLAPLEQALETRADSDYGIHISDAGYVSGSIGRFIEEEYFTKPFIYHESFGFKLIEIGKNYAHSTGVNEAGVVIGWFTNSGNCIWGCDDRIFTFNSQTDEIMDLMSLPELENRNKYAQAIGITNDNLVIVRNINSKLGAFSYNIDQNSVSFDLGDDVQAVNSKGQMIGGDYSWVSDENKAWFFDPTTGIEELGSLDKFNRWPVTPEALSENGYVAGYGRDTQADLKGFLWHKATGLQSFDTLGGTYLRLRAVNTNGWAIGFSETEDVDDDDSPRHAFVYRKDKGCVDLGTLGGADSEAFSINDANQIVGESQIKPRSEKTRAFIWDAKHGMRDLSKLIPLNTGWKELNSARSINNSGYIVGEGIYQGVHHSFLLIPKT